MYSISNNKKSQWDSNSECTSHKTDTLSTQLWRKLHVIIKKILLMKRNFVLIKGQSFCDDVLFHLKHVLYCIDRIAGHKYSKA